MTRAPETWWLGPERGPRVLLLHGLTGGPGELWPLASALASLGWRCELPWWAGHGTTPEALARTSAEALVEQARGFGAGAPGAIVGLSMGALLGVVAASRSPVAAPLVLLAPAWRMAGQARLFDLLAAWPRPGARLLSKGTDWGHDYPGAAGRAGAAAMEASRRMGVRYDAIPLAWSARLRAVRAAARACAPGVRGPVRVIHGLMDGTAAPRAAAEVAGWFPGARADWFGGASHQLGGGAGRREAADLVAGVLGPAPARETA